MTSRDAILRLVGGSALGGSQAFIAVVAPYGDHRPSLASDEKRFNVGQAQDRVDLDGNVLAADVLFTDHVRFLGGGVSAY